MAFSFDPAQSAPSIQETAHLSELELAQALAERLAIKPADWHRLNRDRRVRAAEQLATALIFLLKQDTEEALVRVEQAANWLNRSLQAPPCPTHGERKSSSGSHE